MRHLLALLSGLLLAAVSVSAQPLNVAVASNFAPLLQELARHFTAESGYRLRISSASTGKLFAQIINGAPFDVFLAADAERPAELERTGAAVEGSRFTYATGQLVLWSSRPGVDCETWLVSSLDGKLAIANPLHAPYGVAAKEALEALNLWDAYRTRLVTGENVAQALHFAASGNAAAGLLGAAQIELLAAGGCQWALPVEAYSPIRQQAVVLERAEQKPAARAFVEYLRSDDARRRIREAGYLPAQNP